MRFIIENMTMTEIQEQLDKLKKLQESNKKKNKKYVQSEKGRIATRKASQRYYYKKKCNNRYHPIYNPEGNKENQIEINQG